MLLCVIIPQASPSARQESTRPTRRQEFSAATKRALVDVAEQLFAVHGYAGTSLDAIVAGAQVTKGALYHHFTGKQALFEAVFESVEAAAAGRIRQAVRACTDPWDKATAGLRSFLAVVQEPGYRRIVVQDGPAVLGYERFREQKERSTFGIVHEIVSSVLQPYDVGPSMTETFTHIFFGAMSESGSAVSSANDPAQAGADVEAAMKFILDSLRLEAASGVMPPAASAR